MAAPMNLGRSHFYLSGADQNALSISIPGPVFVLIKMDRCEGSAAVQPIVYTLSGEERSVQYGILNISEHPDVVRMSQRSNLPIVGSPIIVFFFNHMAYARFSGKKKNLISLRSWLRKMVSEIRHLQQQHTSYQQQSFVPSQQSYPGPPRGGPPQRGGFPPGRGGMQQIPAGRQPSFQSHLQNVEDDDDQQLKMPDSVTPHNTPWEAGSRLPEY